MITRNELVTELKEEVKELEQVIERTEDTYSKMYINTKIIEIKKVIKIFDEGVLLANTFRLLSHIITRVEEEEGEREEFHNFSNFTIKELKNKLEKLKNISLNNDAFLNHNLKDRYLNNNYSELNCKHMEELVAELKFNIMQLAIIGIYL